MKIILTYNFADEAVNDQNKQIQSIKEQERVESPFKENNKEDYNELERNAPFVKNSHQYHQSKQLHA